MLDLKLLRENPQAVRDGLAKKKFKDVPLDEFFALDEKRRALIAKKEALKSRLNAISGDVPKLLKKDANGAYVIDPEIHAAWATIAERITNRPMIIKIENLKVKQNHLSPTTPDDIAASMEISAQIREIQKKLWLAEASEIKKEIAAEDEREDYAKIDEQWNTAYLSIPNIPDATTPVGHREEDNVVHATWGDIEKDVSAEAKPHWDIPWFKEAVDFERGVKVTGAGFPFYVGDMARLVRALIQFFLEEANDSGYREVWGPLLVNPASATATGQLPDKEGQMYHAQTDNLYLIPTAEVPVTNFYRDEIIPEEQLPVKFCGYTPCFRREAGSWGAHVRGLNRLHQFDKVELVKWVHPDNSFDELESLRADAERILQKLGLPYRTLLICTGDIGFAHSKQYDLEVWAAGQKRWLEVSSCSNFTDFQARRAGIRYRPKNGGKAETLHTLNGSGLGLPRVLAAILENNLRPDGSVVIPEVLRRWFGKETIGPVLK